LSVGSAASAGFYAEAAVHGRLCKVLGAQLQSVAEALWVLLA
jgi:hypothetical protein